MTELQIDDVAFGGNGVGRAAGKVVFVPFTIDGEQVRARIVREKKQFAEAELVEVLTAAATRVTPECPYFGQCGGCRYQHVDYAHQLELKGRQVQQAMRRIGGITDVPIAPVIPSPKPYGYRNRITVHSEGGTVGFFRFDTHHLIDIEQCPIARDEVNAALAELRANRPRDGHYTLRARPGPRIFEQTNDGVAEELAQLIEQMLPADHALLIDAYCGAGFFTKRFASRFERVVGIEWDRYAIAAAQAGAQPNETYVSGDVAEELSRQLLAADLARTALIADPPATGLSPEVRRALLDHAVATFIYISCNPATLARDLKELRAGYRIISITPLDMFPQTAEIEVAVHCVTLG